MPKQYRYSSVQYCPIQYGPVLYNIVMYSSVLAIIQFLKVMYLVLTVQVPLTFTVVFCERDSVFLGADIQE